jgi:hypothetical protein
MWDRPQIQMIEVLEVSWIARKQWQILRDGDCRNHGVVGPRPRLSTGSV